jgi:hypothetical protein
LLFKSSETALVIACLNQVSTLTKYRRSRSLTLINGVNSTRKKTPGIGATKLPKGSKHIFQCPGLSGFKLTGHQLAQFDLLLFD